MFINSRSTVPKTQHVHDGTGTIWKGLTFIHFYLKYLQASMIFVRTGKPLFSRLDKMYTAYIPKYQYYGLDKL